MACYEQVIALSERNGKQNMDYLMALYFSGDKRFFSVKREMEKNNPALSADLSFFAGDKRRVLLSLYP